MIISYENLNQNASNWTTQLGSAINNPVSVDFIASNLPDGRLKTTNIARAANAGGLVTWKVIPPTIPGFVLNYAKLRTLVMIPSTALYNLRNLETDFIQVLTPAPNSSTPIPNKFNGSTRWNSVSGHFEIDASSASPAWSDIGGGPGSLTPDVTHELINLYQFDYVKLTTSVLSISWDGVIYSVPSTLQNVGVQTSNWTQVLDLQLQDATQQVGSVEVIYNQTSLYLSDQPF
jgi:hypothetical protein